MKSSFLLTLVTAIAATAAVHGQTIDGSIVGDESFYGAALSQQSTRTQFGDNNVDDPIVTGGGGSEINDFYATVANGRLYVMATGNLETNFNKLEFFIDSVSGGVNTIDGDALPASVDGFCCGQSDPNVPATDGALQRMDGLTFDTGFNADYFLTFSNGTESVDGKTFWAMNSHYADLTQGSSGTAQALGIITAPKGLPQVLRNPMDYNGNGTVDAADYTTWRDSEGSMGSGLPADGNGDGEVNQTDYDNWSANFGTDASLGGDLFAPSFDFQTTEQQLAAGNVLPGLAQGQLIDRTYAQAAGGCIDDTGAGCVAGELEFVLDVDPSDPTNSKSHRNFENTVGLELAFDNSNVDGVLANGATATDPDPFAVVTGEDDFASATTGIEFSIPLDQIGNPGEGDTIKITAFVNGTGHDFISNQINGDGQLGFDDGINIDPNRENLGSAFFSDGPDPALLTFVDIAGDQFVSLTIPVSSSSSSIPEPSTAALLLAGLGLARRR